MIWLVILGGLCAGTVLGGTSGIFSCYFFTGIVVAPTIILFLGAIPAVNTLTDLSNMRNNPTYYSQPELRAKLVQCLDDQTFTEKELSSINMNLLNQWYTKLLVVTAMTVGYYLATFISITLCSLTVVSSKDDGITR